MKIGNISKVTQFVSFLKMSLFEIFGKFLESVALDAINWYITIIYKRFFKSDSFKNYKSFVPAEVQNLHRVIYYCNLSLKWKYFFDTNAEHFLNQVMVLQYAF